MAVNCSSRDGTLSMVTFSFCSAGSGKAVAASIALVWCRVMTDTNVFIFLCFSAMIIQGISHRIPTELPTKMYM